MVIQNNLKGYLKTEIGKLVKSIVDLSMKPGTKFHDEEILALSKEIDALIDQYYDTP